MRGRTNIWFEIRVRYDKTMEDGQNKRVIEQYVVDAFSFSEVEEFTTEEMSYYVSGEFDVKAISPTPFGETFFSGIDTNDKWFKTKLSFIILDEKTDKEKHTSVTYLVQAHSVSGTVKHVDEVVGSTVIDYEIAAITETKIMDVSEHHAGKKNEKSESEQ